jgi:hypothetical protein
MFRFTGSALAFLAAFSLAPVPSADAGSREGHRVVKHSSSRLGGRQVAHRGTQRIRVVNRNVVVVKVDAGKRRHKGFRSYGTYSGDVDISVRAGVGQWSYGTSSSLAVTEAAVPMVKIIDVGSLKANNACAMEAGVCVIRP